MNYRGKPVDDMTRDELIAALRESAKYIETLHAAHAAELEYLHNIQTPPIVLWLRRVFGGTYYRQSQ